MSLHKPVIVNSGGVSLWTRQIGNGKPMVFGHGLLGCHEIIEKELSPLIPIYRIIVFDQRGHGNSEKITDCRLYNAELMADDIAANAPLALKGTKRVLNLLLESVALDPQNLSQAEAITRAAFLSEDLKEGRLAFLEKRKPRFKGR